MTLCTQIRESIWSDCPVSSFHPVAGLTVFLATGAVTLLLPFVPRLAVSRLLTAVLAETISLGAAKGGRSLGAARVGRSLGAASVGRELAPPALYTNG